MTLTLANEKSRTIAEWLKAGATATDVKAAEFYAKQTLRDCGFADADQVRAVASRRGRRVA